MRHHFSCNPKQSVELIQYSHLLIDRMTSYVDVSL